MKLLIVLACLFAERYLTGLPALRRPTWIERWLESHQSLPIPASLRQGWVGLATLVLPPLLALWLLQWLFSNPLLGVPGLLLGTAVLLYSLGPTDLDTEVKEFLEARATGPAERTAAAAQALLGRIPGPQDAGPRELAAAVLMAALRRTFAVLFWFLLLGAAGAFGYRMGCELRSQVRELSYPGLERPADTWLWLLDWLPARLLAGLYALAGHFEGALRAWRQATSGPPPDGSALIAAEAGIGALQLDARPQPVGESAADTLAVRAAHGLVGRSLVILIAELVLLTLAAWIA
jgi:membrane protein required for beta-lactamase induction